jgi:hypothetical protein
MTYDAWFCTAPTDAARKMAMSARPTGCTRALRYSHGPRGPPEADAADHGGCGGADNCCASGGSSGIVVSLNVGKSEARMNAKQLRPGAKIAAMHEAGHAVVAAYLDVRIERTRLGKYWGLQNIELVQHPEQWDANDGGETSYASPATLDHQAVVTAAAQVATHELNGVRWEAGCESDEKDLHQIARESEIADSDFQPWRLSIMERARQIVSIEYVGTAIRRVASDLQAAPLEDGLTGEHVREVLRACEMAGAQ